jgi:hypothetical protein
MKAKIFFFITILFMVSGCSSTTLVGSWIDPEVKSVEGKSIAIFCLTPKLGVRDKVETQMADILQSKGVNAFRSLDFITPGKMEPEVITKVLQQNKITSVILVSLLDAQKETHYVPGSTSYYPSYYGRPYYGYYGSVYTNVYDPGYYTTTTSYFIECNAYRLSDGKLAYSSQSKAVDPSSVDKFAYDYSKALVADLEKKGVLGAEKK